MADETPQTDAYEAMIADLKVKRDLIDQAIAALTALKGVGGGATTGAAGRAADPSGNVQAGQFLGLNIGDAVRRLLAMRKTPLGTPEITEALISGGVVFTSDNPANTVGSVLHRQAKGGTDIISVGRGKWALAAWFPNPGRFQKKKAGEKNGDAPTPEPAAPADVDPLS